MEPSEFKEVPSDSSLRTFAKAAARLASDFIERAETLEGAGDEADGLRETLTGQEWKQFTFEERHERPFFTVLIPAELISAFQPLLEHFGGKVYGPSTRAMLAMLDSHPA